MSIKKIDANASFLIVIIIVICMIVGNVKVDAALLRGKAEPLMNRPGQMMGIPSPEGSNFFHPDGLPTWMRPSALPEKFRSPSVPSGGGAMVPASMPVAPAMGINGDAYQNPGQLPSGVPSAGLGGMYGSPVGHNTALGAVSTAVAPGLPGGAGVSFKNSRGAGAMNSGAMQNSRGAGAMNSGAMQNSGAGAMNSGAMQNSGGAGAMNSGAMQNSKKK